MSDSPTLALVAALDEQGVIGAGNRLPWRLPADLRRFRHLTLGHPVVMGRRTHESIGGALDGRDNLVLSRSADFRAPGCRVVADLDTALALCARAPVVMVIGGAAVYAAALPRCERMYLTRVHDRFEGDVFFPRLVAEEWRTVASEFHPADERNRHSFTFVELAR